MGWAYAVRQGEVIIKRVLTNKLNKIMAGRKTTSKLDGPSITRGLKDLRGSEN